MPFSKSKFRNRSTSSRFQKLYIMPFSFQNHSLKNGLICLMLYRGGNNTEMFDKIAISSASKI